MVTILDQSEPIQVDEAQVTNGAKEIIEVSVPYRVLVRVTGVAPLLFHAWNVESIEEKGNAPKGSKGKKTDNLESYVHRDKDGNLGIPGRCLAAAVAQAGRSKPDPRSPRKSMIDLLKAVVVPLSIIAPFEPVTDKWDYLDKQRAVVMRAGITRTRPAMNEGWRCTFELLVNSPEYVSPALLNDLLNQAGRLCGLLDYRPTYGRFTVSRFEVLPD